MSNGKIIRRGVLRPVSTKAIENLPFYKRWSIRLLDSLNLIEKSRQQVPAYVIDTGFKPRLPDIDYGEIWKVYKTHWLLRQISRAIKGEVLNAERTVVPRFKKKCTKCGKEYKNSAIEKCDICEGKKFDKPDIKQYIKATEFIKNPSEGRNLIEFIRSTLDYDLAIDDFYWEVVYEYDGESKTPKYIRVVDGITILPSMNQYGILGSDEYFCVLCYEEQQTELKQDVYEKYDPIYSFNKGIPKCKKCGGEMVQTAYYQTVGGKVVARWAEDEMIYGSSSRIDPETQGNSKILPCIKHLYILDFMDEYNYQVYSHGEVSSLLAFPGLDDTAVQDLKNRFESEINSNKRVDVRTGDKLRGLELLTAFIGIEDGKEPVRIPLMEPLEKLQSLDFYRLYVEKVAGVYGVTPVFTSTTTSENGVTGTRPEIDVQNRVTRGYINDIATPFNDVLLPIFGITDWVLEFGKIESKDMLRDAQIKLTNAQAVNILRTAGFDVDVLEDMSDYTVSEKPSKEVEAGNSRLVSGRLPQQQSDGAPTKTMATGTEQGVPIPEPEDREK